MDVIFFRRTHEQKRHGSTLLESVWKCKRYEFNFFASYKCSDMHKCKMLKLPNVSKIVNPIFYKSKQYTKVLFNKMFFFQRMGASALRLRGPSGPTPILWEKKHFIEKNFCVLFAFGSFFLTGPIWARTVFCIDIGYIVLIYVVKKHLPHIYMIFLNVKENNHVHLFYGTQKLSKTFRIIRDSFKLLEPQILWIRSIFLKIVSSWRPYWFWEKAWWGHRLHPRPRWSKNQEQIDHDEE